MGEKRKGLSRNMYKEPMDKAKGGKDSGWAGKVDWGKWRHLYISNNKKVLFKTM